MLILKKIPSLWINTVATLGGVGYIPKAPGTFGSLVGLLFHICIGIYLSQGMYAWFIFLGIIISVLFCGEAEIRMGKKDPACVVLDEFIAMPVCFFGVHTWGHTWLFWVVGFVLFRFFDIKKPLGIYKLQDLKGGWGVVIDDIAAAIYVNISLRLLGLFIGC